MVMEIRSAKKEDIGNILKVIGSNRFGNEPLPGLKTGVSGLWHTWHDLRPCQNMPEKASASLRKDAIHPQA